MSIAVPPISAPKTKTVVAQTTLKAAPKPKTTVPVSSAVGVANTANPSPAPATGRATYTVVAATTTITAPKPKTTTTAPVVGSVVNAHSSYR